MTALYTLQILTCGEWWTITVPLPLNRAVSAMTRWMAKRGGPVRIVPLDE